MGYINESDKAIIKTLAIYVLMDELEKNKIINLEMLKKHYEGLTEIQKEIVSFFENEKNIMMKKVTKSIQS